MFATYTKNSTIFLCGGINQTHEHVSDEAFLYSISEKTNEEGSQAQKIKIGNNLVGAKF